MSKRRLITILLLVSLGIILTLGLFWNNVLLYAGVSLAMVLMHLFGHGQHDEATKDRR